MEPYDGREPYIFISYARTNGERVTPLLDVLSGTGYRVWYDKGIQAGEYWTKTLAEKINGCAVFCPLFSEAFNASRFCFDETNYAYRKNKVIVPVYLEKMEQESLDEFYQFLGGRQDLRLHQYANATEFAERLGREQAFAPCKVPEWSKIGLIQWRLNVDGVLAIAKNEDLLFFYHYGSIPAYQYDPVYKGSTAPWSPYRAKILSVVIGDDIDAIGDYAFVGCHLASVNISDSVTKIGNYAFFCCYDLTSMCIPNSVTQIGDGAFRDCYSLTNVRIPDGVTKISYRAFWSCHLTAIYSIATL